MLRPIHKHNYKRPVSPGRHYLHTHLRKAIETAGSLLERLLPKHIHAVITQGIELKVILAVFAIGFHCLPLKSRQLGVCIHSSIRIWPCQLVNCLIRRDP